MWYVLVIKWLLRKLTGSRLADMQHARVLEWYSKWSFFNPYGGGRSREDCETSKVPWCLSWEWVLPQTWSVTSSQTPGDQETWDCGLGVMLHFKQGAFAHTITYIIHPYARFPSPSEMPWPNGQELRGNEVFEAVNGADKNPCVCSNQKHQCWQHLLFKWVNWNLKIDVKQKYTGSEQKLKSNDDRVLVLAVARSMCCRIFFWMHVAHADCFD